MTRTKTIAQIILAGLLLAAPSTAQQPDLYDETGVPRNLRLLQGQGFRQAMREATSRSLSGE